MNNTWSYKISGDMYFYFGRYMFDMRFNPVEVVTNMSFDEHLDYDRHYRKEIKFLFDFERDDRMLIDLQTHINNHYGIDGEDDGVNDYGVVYGITLFFTCRHPIKFLRSDRKPLHKNMLSIPLKSDIFKIDKIEVMDELTFYPS